MEHKVILKNSIWNKNDILYERVYIYTYRHIILYKATIVLYTNKKGTTWLGKECDVWI